MRNALKVLSICAALLAVAGCACKNSARGNVRQSAMRTSGRQVAMQSPQSAAHGKQSNLRMHAPGSMQSSPNAAYAKQSMMRNAPDSTQSPQSAAHGRQSTMRTSFVPGSMNAPSQAASGECWSSVYYPPELKTVTERVCLKEPSERFEVSPAEYEWVEETVCVKQASKQFVVVPARYETMTQNVVLDTGHTDWVRADENRCRAAEGESPASDVFCVVNFPKVEKALTAERLVQPASIREVEIPAEYQTVRTQKCVKPATSRRIEIPGEYDTVEKTVEVSPGRWEWQRVNCEGQATAQPLNNNKNGVRKTGYKP